MNDHNLPTLQQILERKTQPPLCLYNYYVVMRDRLYMEEVLDFYLDVQHHEQLWRRYTRSPSGDNQQAVINSAQHLLKHYLAPSAAKELTQLPVALKHTIRTDMERNHRVDPAVFNQAKNYLFELMQRQAYPKFLRVKVWGNVTLWQQLGRMAVGLVALLVALATGLSLIFLGYPTWGVRCWVFLPFWIGVFNLSVFLTGLDPLWVLLFDISETTPFRFNKIKQSQVKRILWSRSVWVMAISLTITS
ncbi:hypothetical protein [Absidia glauca]|uniref:RGS domain-containing protein n=1 Tax=Absidia glauca TaxID=4829 RepID=A0A168MGT1_ABSGL|nr:hypothetical protein [Absidia glauca]